MSAAMPHGPGARDNETHDYDAILVVSFGGPEGPEDVEPFLDNVLAGLPIRPESRGHIAQRYQDYGGVSPINGQVREFCAALTAELEHHGPALPVYWGNRNWHPMLKDTLRQMQADGVRRAAVFVTSMFSSYSGCRRYREDLYAACDGLDNAPVLDKLRLGFNHPGYITACADRLDAALQTLEPGRRDKALVLFTAHSLPEAMAGKCRYVEQFQSCGNLVATAVGAENWRSVFQSNNASYGNAWLEPDVSDAIRAAAAEGIREIVIAPIGFVCDHMEVIIDLDVDAAAVAEELGVRLVRAGTVGNHPAYISMVRALVIERITAAAERPALGSLGPSHDMCAADCCLSGRPAPPKPSLCGL